MRMDFWRDLCYSIRTLGRDPLFTLSIILSLALGIGLNIAIFSFLHPLFLNPVPAVNEPEAVAVIYGDTDGGPFSLPISYPNYRSFLSQVYSFSELAAYQAIRLVMAGEGETGNVSGEMVTANFFPALGVEPAIGRLFLPEEDRTPGAHPVAVLSHDLWRRRFGGEAEVVGRKISLNGHPFTVIGVAEEGFKGMNALSATGIWVPLMMYPTVFSNPELFDLRSAQILQLVGRLGRGVSLPAAEVEMKAVAWRLEASFRRKTGVSPCASIPSPARCGARPRIRRPRRRLLDQHLAEARRASGRAWLLDCRFDHGGPWAGIHDFFASLIDEIRTGRPDLVEAHDYELVHALPELRRSLTVRSWSLTDIAPRQERVRNYPADRAFRIVHGLIDLL